MSRQSPPTLIVQERCATGEGPLWNPFDEQLYWADIPRGRIYRYNPRSRRHELCLSGAAVGGFTIQDDGSLLLFMERGRVQRWQNGRATTLIDELPAERSTRFNDVIADPAGRVFCGTMPDDQGRARLYRLETDGSIALALDDLGQSNGMGFTPDAGGLYLTDTKANTITRYRYDERSGDLSDPEVIVQLAGEYPALDGLTVDSAGCLWAAHYGGGCLARYDQEGREVARIALPTSRVTSAGFGGDGSDLYITTAGGDEAAPEEDPAAGGLFHLRVAVAGRPEFRSRVRAGGVKP
jgi:D-xylonolactonase